MSCGARHRATFRTLGVEAGAVVGRRITHKEQPTRRTLRLRRDVAVEGDTRHATEVVVIRDLDSNGTAISRIATRRRTCHTRPAIMRQTTRGAISTWVVTGT